MSLNSFLKLVIISVIFPAQVNLYEFRDYFDAWERLDELVNVVVEQVEEPSNEETEEMVPIEQSQEVSQFSHLFVDK